MDLSGCFAVLAHTLGDYRGMDVFGIGCINMAADIEGQWYCYPDHSGDTFQVVDYVIAGVSVGALFVEPGITDDWQ